MSLADEAITDFLIVSVGSRDWIDYRVDHKENTGRVTAQPPKQPDAHYRKKNAEATLKIRTSIGFEC